MNRAWYAPCKSPIFCPLSIEWKKKECKCGLWICIINKNRKTRILFAANECEPTNDGGGGGNNNKHKIIIIYSGTAHTQLHTHHTLARSHAHNCARRRKREFPASLSLGSIHSFHSMILIQFNIAFSVGFVHLVVAKSPQTKCVEAKKKKEKNEPKTVCVESNWVDGMAKRNQICTAKKIENWKKSTRARLRHEFSLFCIRRCSAPMKN